MRSRFSRNKARFVRQNLRFRALRHKLGGQTATLRFRRLQPQASEAAAEDPKRKKPFLFRTAGRIERCGPAGRGRRRAGRSWSELSPCRKRARDGRFDGSERRFRGRRDRRHEQSNGSQNDRQWRGIPDRRSGERRFFTENHAIGLPALHERHDRFPQRPSDRHGDRLSRARGKPARRHCRHRFPRPDRL